jgi:hypothetical protein
MADKPSTTGADILRTTETILKTVGTATRLPQPWGFVLSALEAAAGLAADLMDRGLDPSIKIQEMRSALPAVAAARAEVDDLIAQKSHPAQR